MTLPSLAMCGSTSVPAFLIPIYQSASQEYGLGAAGPSILAAINEIETGFGVNQGPSSAGAIGWMQFMPSTWAAYGVDANGDGVRDPSDPEDAIFAAARYLRAGGMPEDPEGAIFAYNHADWYVADVLARAACFSGIGSGAARRADADAEAAGAGLRAGQAGSEPGPGALHEGLPERRRALRPRRRRRLGARGGGPARVRLRPGHERRRSCASAARWGSATPTGMPTRWTATATAVPAARAPATPRPPWPG